MQVDGPLILLQVPLISLLLKPFQIFTMPHSVWLWYQVILPSGLPHVSPPFTLCKQALTLWENPPGFITSQWFGFPVSFMSCPSCKPHQANLMGSNLLEIATATTLVYHKNRGALLSGLRRFLALRSPLCRLIG